MKKIIHILLCLSICMLLTVPAFGASTVSGNGADITDSGIGPDLTDIGLSPNVQLHYSGVVGAYEMSAVNTKGTMEYGVYSASNQIFQQTKTPTDGAITVDTFSSTDGSKVKTWTAMGSTS